MEIADRAVGREMQEDLVCVFGGWTCDDGGMLPVVHHRTKQCEEKHKKTLLIGLVGGASLTRETCYWW